MLASAPGNLGDTAFFIVGPIALFFALAAWITMTLMTSRKPRRPRGGGTGLPHRGPVQGGVILGSPSQRTRRDPAPSVTHRQVMRHIEDEREREAREAREGESQAAARSGRGRKHEKGRRRAPGKRRLRGHR
ncbi:hypothetical protein [Spirillospora sp. NPDC048824]|uniref:hypothetical protein n=1 Tax=Spirillospora sp. NPDC048824 TaxID=3364526 RepID=UPI00372397FC